MDSAYNVENFGVFKVAIWRIIGRNMQKYRFLGQFLSVWPEFHAEFNEYEFWKIGGAQLDHKCYRLPKKSWKSVQWLSRYAANRRTNGRRCNSDPPGFQQKRFAIFFATAAFGRGREKYRFAQKFSKFYADSIGDIFEKFRSLDPA